MRKPHNRRAIELEKIVEVKMAPLKILRVDAIVFTKREQVQVRISLLNQGKDILSIFHTVMTC